MTVSPTLFSSKSDEWSTPQDLYDRLNDEFHFRLDVCATVENRKCSLHFGTDIGIDGLQMKWTEFTGPLWCNPPYSAIAQWVQKASEESKNGSTVVMLIPSRTDTRYFHSYIWNEQTDSPYPGVELRFIRGRLKFGDSKNSAPFPSVIVIFRPQ